MDRTEESCRQGYFAAVLRGRPQAEARISGSGEYPEIRGSVRFYQTAYGVLTAAEVFGLPTGAGACEAPVFAFHIHSGGRCRGSGEDPFAETLGHYDPGNCPHPGHAGDLPPLMAGRGYAFSAFLTRRFSVREIIGRTVVIHAGPDDFATQPSGNSGAKIACGEIRRAGGC